MLHILNILEKCCILEKSRKKLVTFGENSAKFSQILRNFGEKTAKNSAIFNENFEIRARCKGVHCVDLGESFPTNIYLQNLASIQPRTGLLKFEGGGFSARVILHTQAVSNTLMCLLSELGRT